MRTSIISSVAVFTLCIGVGRAECQLFGGAETRNAAGDGLDLAAQVYGAYDDDVLAGATAGAPLGQQTAFLPQSGFYSGLAIGLAYGHSGDISTFRSWANSGVGYSPSHSDLTTIYHQAGLGFSTRLGRGIGLNAGSFADYSPRYSLLLIPVVSPMAPAVGSPLSEVPAVPALDIEYTSIEREAYQYGGSIGLSIPVSSRIFMGVDYGQTQTTSQDELFDMRVRSAAANIGYRITKNASLTAGYYRYDARHAGADSRPTVTENVRVGVDYSKPLSITRRTTLQFSTGSAIAEDLDGQRSLQATGSAIVVHQMGRTWSARAANTAGMLAYPPTLTTTRGRKRRNSSIAARRARHILDGKPAFARVSRRWNPTTSKKVCGNGVSGSSRVSIPRWAPM